MKKGIRKKRWLTITVFILLIILTVSAFTNPTKEDYIKFSEAETGISIPESVRIDEANFIFFTVYAPAHINTIDEYGIAHLGFMGHFFKVTDGQYDDSIWKSFLN